MFSNQILANLTHFRLADILYLETPFNDAQRNLDRRAAELVRRFEPKFR